MHLAEKHGASEQNEIFYQYSSKWQASTIRSDKMGKLLKKNSIRIEVKKWHFFFDCSFL